MMGAWERSIVERRRKIGWRTVFRCPQWVDLAKCRWLQGEDGEKTGVSYLFDNGHKLRHSRL